MGLYTFLSASRPFQTRAIREWMEDDGPASRAHATPAERDTGTRREPAATAPSQDAA